MNRRETANSVNSSNAGNVNNGNAAKTLQPRPTPVWRNTTKYDHQQQQNKTDSVAEKKLAKSTPPTPRSNFTTAAVFSASKSNSSGGANSLNTNHKKLNNNNNTTATHSPPPPYLTGNVRGHKPLPPSSAVVVADKRSNHLQRSNPGKLSSQQQSSGKGGSSGSNTIPSQPEPTPPLSTLNVLLPPHAVKSKTESSINSQMFPRTGGLNTHHKPASEFTTFSVQVEGKKNNANYNNVVVVDPLKILNDANTEEEEKGLEAKEGHCTLTVPLISAVVNENQENSETEQQQVAQAETQEEKLAVVDLPKDIMLEKDSLSSSLLPKDEHSTILDLQEEEEREDLSPKISDQKEDNMTDDVSDEQVEVCEEDNFVSSHVMDNNDTIINEDESTKNIDDSESSVTTTEKGGESSTIEADNFVSNDDDRDAYTTNNAYDHVNDDESMNREEIDAKESENSSIDVIKINHEHGAAEQLTVEDENRTERLATMDYAAEEIITLDHEHENSATSDDIAGSDEPSAPPAEYSTEDDGVLPEQESSTAILEVDTEEMLFEEDLIRQSPQCTQKKLKRNMFSI